MSYGNRGDDENKLFVGGLSWETTEDEMRTYFSQFGEIVSCSLITDRETGRSRGFGFVTYADSSPFEAIANQKHNLNGRDIDPKKAEKRERSNRVSYSFYQ